MLDAPFAAAAAAPSGPAAYALGRFVLRPRERLLLAGGGAPVPLRSRAVEVLLALVEADGALLTKRALLGRVWPDVTVEENNLQVQVSALRRALGPEGRGWIATVPGRGYRFVGPVAALADGEAAAPGARPPVATEPPPLSVLVLPFAGRGGDPAHAWFADALTDGLTTDLARALPAGGAVAAQATADAYRDHHADVRAIGREQGVRYVLEGSVLPADGRVRVNAQLVATDTGAHLWADRFDAPCRRGDEGGVLGVQDAIVGRLARSVGLRMVETEARRAERAEREHPGVGTAEDYVLRARAAANRGPVTREGAEAACALYARALERDPGNADALAGVACARVHRVVEGYLEAGRTVRDEAVAREAGLAAAEAELARALALAPGHPGALKGRAALLRARGAFADAIAAAEAVLAHDPSEMMAHREVALGLLYLGRAEEAVDWFRRAEALAAADDPARWAWLQGLGRALVQLGRDAEAAEALRLAVAANPTWALSHALLAAALALAGEDAPARAAMAEFRRAEPDTPVEALARRAAVPFEATAPLYRERNARVLEGLRRADGPPAP